MHKPRKQPIKPLEPVYFNKLKSCSLTNQFSVREGTRHTKCYQKVLDSLRELHSKPEINVSVKPNEITISRKTYHFNKSSINRDVSDIRLLSMLGGVQPKKSYKMSY